ncbi:hypothetical protein Bca52824_069452 [Brassica carinata]|uniref:Uncharacterized protein n=1 Tax=Brassica carinata TaxID=52824 RepID=A0A8X7Q3K6_BRACI|nr:hypothetical protein Bca52824_069452 [Brassica carinata]
MMAIRSPLTGPNQSSTSQSSVKKLGVHRSAVAKLTGKEQRNAFVSARNLFGGETPDGSHLWEPIQNLHLASPTKEDERHTFCEESLLVPEASLRGFLIYPLFIFAFILDNPLEVEKNNTELSPLREALSPIDSNSKPNSADGLSPMLRPMTPKTPFLAANAESMQMSGTCQKFNAWSTNLKERIKKFQKTSLMSEYIHFLNTANREELMELKGIGEKMAEYIIELRELSPLQLREDRLHLKTGHNLFKRATEGILEKPLAASTTTP